MTRKKSHTEHEMLATIEKLYDQLVEARINTRCFCHGTRHYPCPRCEVTHTQTDDMLDLIVAEYGFERR